MRPSQRAKKTRAQYVIGRNQAARQAKGKKSIPEILFNEYQESRQMGLLWSDDSNHPITIPVIDPETGEKFDFEIDFGHPVEVIPPQKQPVFDYIIEVDGNRWHKKASKERWKNHLKNLAGVRVFHIPAIMTAKHWWPTLDTWLWGVIISGGPVEYLDRIASGLV